MGKLEIRVDIAVECERTVRLRSLQHWLQVLYATAPASFTLQANATHKHINTVLLTLAILSYSTVYMCMYRRTTVY